MTAHRRSTGDARTQPTIGKDHLNLADWRVTVATYQRRTGADGAPVDFAEYVIRRADGKCQTVTLEAPATIGLPTAAAEDVLIGLLHLAHKQCFASDVVHFVPTHLLRIMHWAITQKNYRRLEQFLKQLRAVTLTYKLAWYDRATATVEPILITGVLAEAKLVLHIGRRPANSVPKSYVQWTKHFYTSLQQGNLTDLDLDLYFSWERPGAKHLHRHLNKVWHSGRRPKPYERDLRELACGHLGMTDNKDLKRNFDRIVQELIRGHYLAPDTVRYRKVRPGVWRVRLGLHPDQVRSTKRGGESRATHTLPSTDASSIVREYHRHRFGRAVYAPTRREIDHAKNLLTQYGAGAVWELIPDVARAVAAQSANDLYFGYAVPLLRAAVDRRERGQRAGERDRQADQAIIAAQEGIDREIARRQTWRTQLLTRWRALSEDARRTFHRRALEQCGSDMAARRLRRCGDLSNPPIEVLDVMASDLGLPRGD